MIRILFLTGNFDTGGKERQLSELIKNLPKDQIECHLLVKSGSSYLLENIKDSLASFNSLNKLHFGFNDVFALKNIISKIKPDIIHCFASTPAHLAAIARFIGNHDFKIINGSIRDAPVKLTIGDKIRAFLYSFYNIIIANSEAGLAAYGQKNKNGRYVIYNGYDTKKIPAISTDQAKEKLNVPSNLFVVCMIAQFHERKDQKAFIDAAQICLKKNPDFRFYLVGDGPTKIIHEKYALERKMKIGEDLIFLGSRKNVEEILLASDVSLQLAGASHGEGISNSIMESLACGIPVIATSGGGTEQIIIDDENGFIVPRNDPVTVAEKIMFLKNNKERLSKMKLEAPKIINKKFNFNKMIKIYNDLYKKILIGE